MAYTLTSESYIGANDGTITLTGVSTFIWTDGFAFQDRINLSPGTYEVTGLLEDGITSYNYIIEILPAVYDKLELTITTTPISCPDVPKCTSCNDGEIQLTAIGGNSLTAVLYNSSGTAVGTLADVSLPFTGLAEGKYKVIVTSDDGQVIEKWTTVNQPDAPYRDIITEAPATFPGQEDGSQVIKIYNVTSPLSLTSTDGSVATIDSILYSTEYDESGEIVNVATVTIINLNGEPKVFEGTYGEDGCYISINVHVEDEYECAKRFNVELTQLVPGDRTIDVIITSHFSDTVEYRTLPAGIFQPIISGEQINCLENGVHEFEFRNSVGCIIKKKVKVFDLITPQQTSHFTISYAPASQGWVSFHTWKPTVITYTSEHLYSFYNYIIFEKAVSTVNAVNSSYSSIFQHNIGRRGLYYNIDDGVPKPAPSFIDIIVNSPEVVKLDSLKWYSELYDEDRDIYLHNKSITSIAAWNPYFSTGLIDLDSDPNQLIKNNRQAEFMWHYNEFRGRTKPSHRFIKGMLTYRELIKSALYVDPDSWYKNYLIARYHIVRLLYDNKDHRRFMLRDTTPNAVESFR